MLRSHQSLLIGLLGLVAFACEAAVEPSEGEGGGDSATGAAPAAGGNSENGSLGGDPLSPSGGGSNLGGGPGFGGASGGATGGTSPSGGMSAGSFANGESCTANSDCAAENCTTEGICCDLACSGTCTSCLEVNTGFADGICAAIEQGEDPYRQCVDQGAVSCGSTGAGCNGDLLAPDCELYGVGLTCAASGCVDGVEFSSSTCDGAGTCQEPDTTQSCGGYTCNEAGTACETSCTGDSQCREGFRCNTDSCAPEGTSGTIGWIETWQALPGEARPGVSPYRIHDVTSSADGDLVYMYSCTLALVPGVSCSPENGDDIAIVDGTTHENNQIDLGFRVTGEQVKVDASGAVAVALTNLDNTGNAWAGTGTYRADRSGRWTRSLQQGGLADRTFGSGLAVADSSSLVVTYSIPHSLRIDHEDGSFSMDPGSVAGTALVKYNAAGQLLWAEPWHHSIQVDATSTGHLWGAVDGTHSSQMGCAPDSAGALVVARLSDDVATCDFKKALGVTTLEQTTVTTPDGGVVVVARVSGELQWGGQTVGALGDEDLLLLALEADGSERWMHRMAWNDSDPLPRLSVAQTSGHVMLSGSFSTAVTIDSVDFDPIAGNFFFARFAGADGVWAGGHVASGRLIATLDPNGSALFVSDDWDLDLGAGLVFSHWGHAAGRLDF